MSGENLVKFHSAALDRVRDMALGMLGSTVLDRPIHSTQEYKPYKPFSTIPAPV